MRKILLVIAALIVAPATALAQGQVRETIPAAPFLAGAYAFMWVAVLIYVALVARRLSRVQSDIEDLRRKLDRGAR
jgi:HAMP domain-containing protein